MTDPQDETPRRDRRVRGTPMKTYLWEQVPRQLLDDAKAKARSEETTIKAVLLRLLRDWTYAPPPPPVHRRPDGQIVAPGLPAVTEPAQ